MCVNRWVVREPRSGFADAFSEIICSNTESLSKTAGRPAGLPSQPATQTLKSELCHQRHAETMPARTVRHMKQLCKKAKLLKCMFGPSECKRKKKKSQIFRSPKNTGTESVRTEVFTIRLGQKRLQPWLHNRTSQGQTTIHTQTI